MRTQVTLFNKISDDPIIDDPILTIQAWAIGTVMLGLSAGQHVKALGVDDHSYAKISPKISFGTWHLFATSDLNTGKRAGSEWYWVHHHHRSKIIFEEDDYAEPGQHYPTSGSDDYAGPRHHNSASGRDCGPIAPSVKWKRNKSSVLDTWLSL